MVLVILVVDYFLQKKLLDLQDHDRTVEYEVDVYFGAHQKESHQMSFKSS